MNSKKDGDWLEIYPYKLSFTTSIQPILNEVSHNKGVQAVKCSRKRRRGYNEEEVQGGRTQAPGSSGSPSLD